MITLLTTALSSRESTKRCIGARDVMVPMTPLSWLPHQRSCWPAASAVGTGQWQTVNRRRTAYEYEAPSVGSRYWRRTPAAPTNKTQSYLVYDNRAGPDYQSVAPCRLSIKFGSGLIGGPCWATEPLAPAGEWTAGETISCRRSAARSREIFCENVVRRVGVVYDDCATARRPNSALADRLEGPARRHSL